MGVIHVAKENDQYGTIPTIAQLASSPNLPDWTGYKTYPAEAATTSCLLALVKAESAAEKIIVNASIRIITLGVLEIVPLTDDL